MKESPRKQDNTAALPLSAIIVDDEQLARQELAYLLESHPDLEVIAQGRNGIEAVELIRRHEPDIVFLDVQMPGLDGFGVIRKLVEKKAKIPTSSLPPPSINMRCRPSRSMPSITC